jgi:hypothetical protein
MFEKPATIAKKDRNRKTRNRDSVNFGAAIGSEPGFKPEPEFSGQAPHDSHSGSFLPTRPAKPLSTPGCRLCLVRGAGSFRSAPGFPDEVEAGLQVLEQRFGFEQAALGEQPGGLLQKLS